MFLEMFVLFATVEINYFVPFGFGNLKMGTDGSSYSLVTGCEVGGVRKITLTTNSLESIMLTQTLILYTSASFVPSV